MTTLMWKGSTRQHGGWGIEAGEWGGNRMILLYNIPVNDSILAEHGEIRLRHFLC